MTARERFLVRAEGGPSAGDQVVEWAWPLPPFIAGPPGAVGVYSKVSESELPQIPGVVRGARYVWHPGGPGRTLPPALIAALDQVAARAEATLEVSVEAWRSIVEDCGPDLAPHAALNAWAQKPWEPLAVLTALVYALRRIDQLTGGATP